jgi:electron transfer flavoprotein alpha subunit
MTTSDYSGIWVFAEQRSGELHEVSLELLGKARELADQANKKVIGILLGHDVKPLAQNLINCGADAVLLADDAHLENYRLLPYALVLESLIKTYQPEILLMGATALGVELAPRVAAKVRTGLSAHCIDLKLDSKGKLLQVVPGWGGGVIATISCPDHRPQMATVMPGTMKALSPVDRTGKVREIQVKRPRRIWDLRSLRSKGRNQKSCPWKKRMWWLRGAGALEARKTGS